MMTIKIEEMSALDLPDVMALWNEVIKTTTITFTTTCKTLEGLQAWLDEGTPRFVAHDEDGTFLGFIGVCQFRNGPGYRFAYEHSIMLTPEARGKGAGRALIEALCSALREIGGHVLVAGISGENSAGIAFHQRCGFAHAGQIPEVAEKFGRRIDLVLMQRRI